MHLNSLAGDHLQANATIKSGLGCNGSELMEEEGGGGKLCCGGEETRRKKKRKKQKVVGPSKLSAQTLDRFFHFIFIH